MKKKKKQNIALTGIVVIVIFGVVLYNHYSEQNKIQGYNFGNDLQIIQDDLKKLQNKFDSKMIQLEEGDLSTDEFLEYSKNHVQELEKIIPRYGDLRPPDSFITSVELFRLSTESQLESDIEFIKWLETGNESHKIRSDSLIQEAFQYELAALAEYKEAQRGAKP